MHGISNSYRAKVGRQLRSSVTFNELRAAPAPSFNGMRNLLPLNPADAFGGEQHRGLMRRLAARIGRERAWPDTLPGAAQAADNPRIPSGYTYLLQFIAHDLINTSISLSAAEGDEYGVHNARVQALSLDTLFGSGPDGCPHAYAYSQECDVSAGALPRTRLRIGCSRAGTGLPAQPDNDIGRAIGLGVQNDFKPTSHSPISLTEPLIADARNDDHALISQLTLLWHRLHNYIIGRIEGSLKETGAERAYHSFILSRFAVMLIFRKIVLYDVLGKLLHPVAFKHYVLEEKPLISAGARGIPVEFAHGAFRCGHAMVRDTYRVRGEEAAQERETARALMQSSQRFPQNVPVSEDWVVDWRHFFPTDSTSDAATVNYSRRLGPNISGVLKSELFFRPIITADLPGLHSRDLVSSIFAGMWSVPALIRELRSRSPKLANFLPAYAEYEPLLATWLNAQPTTFGDQFENGDVDQIVKDPPLPFFTLFEAAVGDRKMPLFKGWGQYLGPLGSIIVAETILGAMAEHPLSVGDKELDPRKPFAEGAAALEPLGFSPVLAAEFPEIRSMPELLTFMRAKQIIR